MMSHNPDNDPFTLKQGIRDRAHANRRAQTSKDEVSRAILARLMSLEEFARARTVMFYVDVRDEVRTRFDLMNALNSDKRIVVPYCVDGSLELFHLSNIDELDSGKYGVLEPRIAMRKNSQRRVEVDTLDLIVVPGVAFDPQGGRLGHGRGYFDKLLAETKPTTTLVGIAFDCQVFSEVPMESHDVPMDRVVTETTVYRGRGRD